MPQPAAAPPSLSVWQAVPQRRRIELIASHAVLLAGAVWADASYAQFQLLVAAEILASNLTTIPLYPKRGWRKHAVAVMKLIPVLAFMVGLALLSYGVAANKDDGYPLVGFTAEWSDYDSRLTLAAVAWIFTHHAIALWLARASPDPRLTWARDRIMEGSATTLALLAVIPVNFLVGVPLGAFLRWAGAGVSMDVVLIALMVVVRLGVSALLASTTRSELEAIAENPYPDEDRCAATRGPHRAREL